MQRADASLQRGLPLARPRQRTTCPWGRLSLVASASLLLALLPGGQAEAQDGCEAVLVEAGRLYTLGDIDGATSVLGLDRRESGPCFGWRQPRELRTRAWELAVRIHLVRDDLAEARAAADELARTRPEYIPAIDEPPGLVALVARATAAYRTDSIVTPSRFRESARETAASVFLVTAEQIRRRGYLDLEAILRDLPGIDISRSNGEIYSSIYMRGLRTDYNDGFLFLVDGVEHNDLHSGTAWLSRQYPVGDIARVEVLYGPASAVWGRGARSGVVHVITKSATELLGDERRLAITSQASRGPWNTSLAEASVAGRIASDRLRWSITGRRFVSDEYDLGDLPEWDYELELRDFDYVAATRLGGSAVDFLNATSPGILGMYLAAERLGVIRILRQDGRVRGLEVTDLGAERMRARDARAELLRRCAVSTNTATCDDLPGASFTDRTENWYAHGKLEIDDLVIGAQLWQRSEGIAPAFTDVSLGGELQGDSLIAPDQISTWIPEQRVIYARYDYQPGSGSTWLADAFRVRAAVRYSQHELDRDSRVVSLGTFASGVLGIHELIWSSGLFDDEDSGFLLPFGRGPGARDQTLQQASSQFRADLLFDFEPSPRFRFTAGADFRSTSGNGDFESAPGGTSPHFGDPTLGENPTPGDLDVMELGVFAQTAASPLPGLRLTMGGRLDRFDIRRNQSLTLRAPPRSVAATFDFLRTPSDFFRDRQFGVPESTLTRWSPRAAAMYRRGAWSLRARFDRGFQLASNRVSYARDLDVREFVPTTVTILSALEDQAGGVAPVVVEPLRAAETDSFELGVGWRGDSGLAIDVAAYEARHRDVAVIETGVTGERLLLDERGEARELRRSGVARNRGRFTIRGMQAWASYEGAGFDVYANYTYTEPLETDPRDEFGAALVGANGSRIDERRVGDIASHRFNAGGSVLVAERLRLHGRVNWIGARPTGASTTVFRNPFERIDGGLLAHATATWEGLYPGIDLQVISTNLFDTQRWDPGVRIADGRQFAARLPQPGRTLFVRLLVDLPAAR